MRERMKLEARYSDDGDYFYPIIRVSNQIGHYFGSFEMNDSYKTVDEALAIAQIVVDEYVRCGSMVRAIETALNNR